MNLNRGQFLRTLLAMFMTAGFATAGLVVITASPASAQDCDYQENIDHDGREGDALCSVDHPGSPPSTTDYRAVWERYCGYWIDQGTGGHAYRDHEATGAPLTTVEITWEGEATPQDVEDWGYNPTGTYGLLTAICTDNSTDPATGGVGGTFIYTITEPVPVTVLRDRARARINIDDPPTASNPSYEDRFAVVQLETWLWLEDGYWVRHHESESSGFVQVDVWARPDTTTWSFGNGDVETCRNPGTPWVPGADITDCGHTFTRSSAGQPGDAFSGETTVTWIFSWAVNGAPQGDFGGPFLATTTFDIQVGEIQAVES